MRHGQCSTQNTYTSSSSSSCSTIVCYISIETNRSFRRNWDTLLILRQALPHTQHLMSFILFFFSFWRNNSSSSFFETTTKNISLDVVALLVRILPPL